MYQSPTEFGVGSACSFIACVFERHTFKLDHSVILLTLYNPSNLSIEKLVNSLVHFLIRLYPYMLTPPILYLAYN